MIDLDAILLRRADEQCATIRWNVPAEPRQSKAGGCPKGKNAGERNGRARKWTSEQVREIRRRHAIGESIPAISRDLHVSWYGIRKVITRQSYAWVEDDA